MAKTSVSIEIISVICLLCAFEDTLSLRIEEKFINGSVEISWEHGEARILHTYVMFTGDSKRIQPWMRVEDAKFSIKDALNYSNIRLSILLRYRNYSYSEFQLEIGVKKQFFKEGETGTISWGIAAFPKSGVYAIFHSESEILQGKSSVKSKKYVYLSTPINSTNVIFQIRNITPNDAGTYTGGTSRAVAEKGNKVHAIVYGKPSKPIVTGQSAVNVGDYVTLECSSKSTSKPEYYKLFPSITYEWYKNNNYIKSGKILRLIVEKNFFLDVITCKAEEKLHSDLSDPVQIEKPKCSEKNKINSKFVKGTAVFTWPRQTVTVKSQIIYVTLNGNMILPRKTVDNQKYEVIDCLKHSSIEVDVKYILQTGENEVCRGLFMNSPDILIVKEGEKANLHWTIPRFPSSGVYSIFRDGHSIIKITDSRASSISSVKYIYKSSPVNSPGIKFDVNNTDVADAGHYTGGSSSSSAQNTKGILLIVAGKPSTPIIKADKDAEYGKTITLTCNSSSSSVPKYYRDLLSWSYTWYRNGSLVQHGSTYMFRINLDKMYDEIGCRTKEVVESNSSNPYKIRLRKSSPAPPNNILISSISPKTLKVSWKSDYDGGSAQYFLIYQHNNTLWEIVANISDSNSTIHSAEVPVGAEGVHGVAVIACNKIGCSMPAKPAKESKKSLEDTDKGKVGVALGTVTVVVIAILVMVGALHKKYGLLDRLKR